MYCHDCALQREDQVLYVCTKHLLVNKMNKNTGIIGSIMETQNDCLHPVHLEIFRRSNFMSILRISKMLMKQMACSLHDIIDYNGNQSLEKMVNQFWYRITEL